MADDIDVKDTPAEPAADKNTPPSPAPASPPAVEGGPAPSGDAPSADTPVEQRWYPDDWKDKIAGGDKTFRKVLDRYGSLEAYAKSGWELRKARDSGQLRAILPEAASQEEVAAFRRSNGIPDTPEGYEIAVPAEIELTDDDKAQMERFRGVFHANNLPPAVARSLTDAFFADRLQTEAALRDAAQEKTIANRAEMRSEYGKDYVQNTTIAKQWLDGLVGAESRNKITDTILSDGTRLGDHPDFVRLVVQGALAGTSDAKLIEAEFGGGGKSIEDQFSEAIALKFADPAAYASQAHQDRLFKLSEAMNRKSGA
jgi:hypothetical protein